MKQDLENEIEIRNKRNELIIYKAEAIGIISKWQPGRYTLDMLGFSY